MRKILFLLGVAAGFCARAQEDSLATTQLQEIVITGTRFELSAEESGKTIYKLDAADLQRNAGKTVADLLNEVPGIQTDGNFSTPGANLSYYVRGGRNKHTLILIDGVPLNDPSSISAEYDLRYVPLSQIESIEVLKGGLSTLYGTSAAAGVISIRLKDSGADKIKGLLDVNAGSYETFGQNALVSGKSDEVSWLVSANNMLSKGFSSALDTDPAREFDDDGLSKQNVLVKGGYAFNPRFRMDVNGAYEQFTADYDEYEFFDAPNTQDFKQFRVSVNPQWILGKGSLEGRITYSANDRVFTSSFPADLNGQTAQAELIHRHRISDKIQMLSGVQYQRMSFDDALSPDARVSFSLLDPYTSLFADFPFGLNVHAGVRINTHSVYGSRVIYNVNPSFTFNKEGSWRYKVLASVSTSYITPSLYQLYSVFGNDDLHPEKSRNFEGGFSVYHKRLALNAVWFARDERDPIDFVTLVDENGNYIGGEYQNIAQERNVSGVEFDAIVFLSSAITLSGNLAYVDTDLAESFYKIPKIKYGATLTASPSASFTFSLKYNHTGDRTIFDFFSFSEIELASYSLVDSYAEYTFSKNVTLYGAVNNLFDEDFIALYGFTTRGRNFNVGVRYNFRQ